MKPALDEYDFRPWEYLKSASASEKREHEGRLRERFADRPSWSYGEDCFVSDVAMLKASELHVGDRCVIAGFTLLDGDVTLGDDCSVNLFSMVRGRVRAGDGVRIGAHTSILGFNHTFDGTDPIHTTPIAMEGISIGDDVWIGSNVVVLDGVKIGAHSVIGAGSVVTRDVPEWSVAVGNPARVVRSRRDGHTTNSAVGEVALRFGEMAKAESSAVLENYWVAAEQDGQPTYRDRPDHPPTVRAHCDAIEIADLLLGQAPDVLSRADHVARLKDWQDPQTGLVFQLDETGRSVPRSDGWKDKYARYHAICVGHALAILDAGFDHTIRPVSDMSAEDLVAAMEELDWGKSAWPSGGWVDAWATAARFTPDPDDSLVTGSRETMIGWLYRNLDPRAGVWGDVAVSAHQAINGTYRIVRGAMAPDSLPPVSPMSTIDTVLSHAYSQRWFGGGRENACNVLDVAYLLWWCRPYASSHRSDEIRAWAEWQLRNAVEQWRPGRGFPFSFDGRPESVATLQGTEMWLATIWYLADLLDVSSRLGYEPRGVHETLR